MVEKNLWPHQGDKNISDSVLISGKGMFIDVICSGPQGRDRMGVGALWSHAGSLRRWSMLCSHGGETSSGNNDPIPW